jgi:hypothetical protein
MKIRKSWLVSIAVALLVPMGLVGACSSSSDTSGGSGNNGTGNSANSGTGNTGTGNNGATGGSTIFGGNGGNGGTVVQGGGGTGQGGSGLQGGMGPCTPVECAGHVYECADCVDNEGDGLTDWMDPGCLGPCDNTESTLTNGIPGANNAPCKMDCFWDSNSGSGNDDCYWDHQCDPLEPSLVPSGCHFQDPPPANADCPDTQSQACLDFCLPLTPNGCDCFGCCELPGGSGNWVYLNSEDAGKNPTCTFGVENDPNMCHPCTPVIGCMNSCEHCEICLGKPELPDDCYGSPDGGTPDGGPGWDGGWTPDGGPTPQCPGGQQPCGLPGQDACPYGYYCITGCCFEAPA